MSRVEQDIKILKNQATTAIIIISSKGAFLAKVMNKFEVTTKAFEVRHVGFDMINV